MATGHSVTDGEPEDSGRGRMAVMGDVAALAGVSQMTVSRVINNRPGVSSETRARVIAAMHQLDYRPNAAARALVTGRSKTLGVVSFDSTLYGPASTLYGIEVAARAAGYFVSVATMRTLDRSSIIDAVGRLTEQNIDGVIVIAPHASAVEGLHALTFDLPVVALEGGVGSGSPVVAVDQRVGAARATQHLLSLGHETVWHVAGPSDWLEACARRESWQATLLDAGREVPPLYEGDWSASSGYGIGQELAQRPDVTAVFVGNDHMALGLLRALHEAGRGVPEQVSVVGFDDIPEAAYFIPPLTTVRQDFGAVGRRSIALLLEQLEHGQPRTKRAIIEPDLVLRESTGPPPAR